MSKSIYTVTSYFKGLHSPRTWNSRCFGFFFDELDADDAIFNNSGNMHECKYNYLVLEKQGEGIHSLAEVIQWYKWDADELRWDKIDAPDWTPGTCNFAGIG